MNDKFMKALSEGVSVVLKNQKSVTSDNYHAKCKKCLCASCSVSICDKFKCINLCNPENKACRECINYQKKNVTF